MNNIKTNIDSEKKQKTKKQIDENRRKHIQKQDEELIKLVSKLNLNKSK